MRQAVEKSSTLLPAYNRRKPKKKLFPVFVRNEGKTTMIFFAHFTLEKKIKYTDSLSMTRGDYSGRWL